ncbi:dTMP kinase [Candidatus Peregrinibacteria bacterium]|nr:dTMP kinase [Candidatus Peregrinibacteria bacterium]
MAPFIVLEGPDGSGTTLHSGLLASTLRSQGKNIVLTAEPTDGPIGKFIRIQLKGEHTPLPPDALQLLFTADRAMHQTFIRDALHQNTVVISDRYSHSTIAYGEALGCDRDWLKNTNNKFIQPDCTIFLLPPLSVCLERVARRENKDSLEATDLQQKVYAAYERLAKEDPSIHVVDTSGNKNEVSKKILEIVSKNL